MFQNGNGILDESTILHFIKRKEICHIRLTYLFIPYREISTFTKAYKKAQRKGFFSDTTQWYNDSNNIIIQFFTRTYWKKHTKIKEDSLRATTMMFAILFYSYVKHPRQTLKAQKEFFWITFAGYWKDSWDIL